MIKVVPYIQTAGSEKFKEFLASSFTFDQLLTLFEGWKGKDMTNWWKYTNDDKVVLEVFPDKYVISKTGNAKYGLNLPKTINHFINDMERFGIELYWGDWIDEKYEPKDYLHKDEIRQYYVNLLAKLDKSNELQ